MVALQRQRLSQLLGGAGRLCDTSCETSYHGSQALLCPKTLNTIAILGGMRQQCSLHVCWYTNTCYVLQARCFGARVLHVTKDLVPCALPLLDSSTLECREKQRRLKRVFGRQHFLTQRPTLGQVRSVRRTGREEVSGVLKARTTIPVINVRGSSGWGLDLYYSMAEVQSYMTQHPFPSSPIPLRRLIGARNQPRGHRAPGTGSRVLTSSDAKCKDIFHHSSYVDCLSHML